MLRSMFAGVSGLRSHQTMMDVTGNNIANVNTSGYKSSRATFQDAIYQAVRGATGGLADAAPGGPDGGVNPMQIGLGSNVASIDGNFSQGALQLTNRTTDVALSGEGMFVLENNEFTRAGTFNFDNAGNLVAPQGELVLGWLNPDATDATWTADPAAGAPVALALGDLTQYQDISINNAGQITARDAAGDQLVLGQLAVATFNNYNGLNRVGQSKFQESAASGAVNFGVAGDGRGVIQGGTLEMSNVDLAQEFTQLIMSQRGFQANARTITTSDELLQELVNIKR